MNLNEYKNHKGNLTGVCVIVKCIAGTDDQVLTNLLDNFSQKETGHVLPVSIGYIQNIGDFIIPMFVKDISDVEDIIIDKIRTVEGVCDVKSYIYNLRIPPSSDESTLELDSEKNKDIAFLDCHGVLFVDVQSGVDRDVLYTISKSGNQEVVINFLGHCFHSFDCDLVAFVSAKDQKSLHEWVRKSIRSIDGVIDTATDVVSQMTPLIDTEHMTALMDIFEEI